MRIAVILTVLVLASSAIYLQRWTQTELTLPTEALVEFPSRTNLATLATKLEQAGMVSSAALFRLYVRWRGNFKQFQAGNYRIVASSISPAQLVEKFIQGDVNAKLFLSLTFPEGLTLRKIVARMVAHGIGDKASNMKLASDKEYLRSLKLGKAPTLEGYLYPATYNFYQRQPTAREVFSAMVSKFFSMLPADYERRAADMGINLYEAVKIASLIEVETGHDDERERIAEVIWRRLQKNTPIGIDASVIYGIADYRGNLTRRHLRDRNNPYNSRVHRGLPPTPISSPSLASLLAVLNPTDEGVLFYVLIPDGKRRHHFSKTLQEHNIHVQRLVRNQVGSYR